MPRTRGQEVALLEQGLPTTPPQQLPTPRRTQKAKVGNRKTKQPVAVASEASQQIQTISRATRTRSTSASQSDAQALKPVRAGVRKRGRQTKPKAVTQSTNEEINGEEVSESKVLQELSENSNSQAVQLAPRENPSISSRASIPPSSFPNLQSPISSTGTTQPLKKVESIAKIEGETSATLSFGDVNAHLGPGLSETDPGLPLSECSQEHKLAEIIRNVIPIFIALLRNHPEIKGNAALEHVLTEREISVSMKPSAEGRVHLASGSEEQAPKVVENTPRSSVQTLESGSGHSLKRKIDKDDTVTATSKRLRTKLDQTKRVPVLFDDDGMLSLRAYKEVPVKEGVSSGEEAADTDRHTLRGAISQNQHEIDRSPETPRSRGWILSGFLPSAQTVSRFLPTFSRRTQTVTPTSVREPTIHDQTTPPSASAADRLQPEDSTLLVQESDRTFHSEPRSVRLNGNKDEKKSTTGRHSRRHRHPKAKHALKTKAEQDEIRKRDEMIASLRAQLQAQTESQAQKVAQAEMAHQAEKMAHSEKMAQQHREALTQIKVGSRIAADEATVQTPKPSLKRKAVSPKVIPNPPGGGYGMVLDYFGQDSDSEDDDVVNVDSPTGPPSKKTRLSGESTPLYIGDRFRATPYLGTELALPPLPTESSGSQNLFLDSDVDAALHIPTNTPSNGPTVTIKVPSPSESDSEWDGTSYVESSEDLQVTPSATTSSMTCTTKDVQSSGSEKQNVNTPCPSQQSSPFVNNLFSLSGSASNTNPPTTTEQLFPSTWIYPAPYVPRPPSTTEMPNVALEKARQSALKHKPQQPSRLRETARISTSTVGTEGGDDENRKGDIGRNESAYEIGHPASDASERDRNEQAHNEIQGLSLPDSNASTGSQPPQEPEAIDQYAGKMIHQFSHNSTLPKPAPSFRESPPPSDHSPKLSGETTETISSSDEDMSDDMPVFNGYAEYEKTLTPRVREYLRQQWGDDKNETGPASELRNEACTIIAEQFDEYEKSHDYKAQTSQTGIISEKVYAQVEMDWTEADERSAIEKFDKEFEAYLNASA